MLCKSLISIKSQQIHGRKGAGDTDVLRTDLRAVIAGGAGNQRNLLKLLLSLRNHSLLLRIQPLESLHVGKIIFHLIYTAHSGKYSDDALQACRETDCPGSYRGIGFGILKHLCHGLRRICQHAALDGLHDNHRLAVFSGYFVAGLRLHGRILPVRVVNLQLNELHLRMLIQDVFQLLRRGMERKAHMLNQPFLLLFLHPAPHVKIIKIFCTALSQVMEQIEIKIACSRLLQRGIKLSDGFLSCLTVNPGRVLGSQLETLTRIALYQRLADRILTSRVGPCCIKISKTSLKKQIHHLFCLLHIDCAVFLLRKPHKAKTKFSNCFT